MALMESSQKKAFEAAIKDLGKKVDEALVEIKKRELEETHSEEEKEKKKEEAKLQSKEKP
jgi:ribosomal protein S21